MQFIPYLTFDGTCREAFTRYQEILGGQLDIMTMADIPEGDRPPGVPSNMTMHAALTVGDALILGSDDMPGGFAGVRGMTANCTVDDVAEAERIFAALADGGETTMPIGETFWSPRFGMCTDRFGTPWMVNTNQPPDA